MNYNKRDIKNCLIDLGISSGDIIHSHANLGYFGIPEGGMSEERLFSTFYEAVFETIGDSGAWILPTFTYSFNSRDNTGVFDYKNSKSNMGFLAEKIRKLDSSYRTLDPMFSMAIHGNLKYFNNYMSISTECFGERSAFDFLYKKNAKIVNFNFYTASTYIHYAEKQLNVTYRKDLLFKGKTIIDDKVVDHSVVFFCRDLESNIYPEFTKFDKLAMDRRIGKKVKLGRGSISTITAKQTFDLIAEALPEYPDFLIERK